MIKNQALMIAKESLIYNHESGVLTWLKGRADRIGKSAGNVDSSGYRKIMIGGINFRAHRLCWMLAYGEYPNMEIDHINGIKDDNRLCNLRQVTRSENCMNMKLRSDNKSGFKGVYWREHAKRFTANIWKDGKRKSLGYFDTAQQAHNAYVQAATHIHGEFANSGITGEKNGTR